MENVWIHQESSRAFPVYFWIIRLLLTTRGVAPAGQWFFLFPVFLPHTFHCVKFFWGGGFLGGNSAHIFRVRNLVSPLHTTTFSTSHPPLACVQPARLSSAPSAGGSGLSGTKEKAIQELCAARWRKAPFWTLGGSERGPRAGDLTFSV